MGSQESIYESVTNRIVAELEAGAAPWVKPWAAGAASGMPYNTVSQRSYSGVNVMILWFEGANRGYRQAAWLTFRQAKELGGHIRKGEKGIGIVYASTFKKKSTDPETGEESQEQRSFLKGYTVFNVEQTEGLPQHLYRIAEPKPFEQAIAHVESVIEAIAADRRQGGAKAFYSPQGDYIQLPHPSDFQSAADFYSTSLHEHAHWTGHASRLARDLTGRFGSQAYAAEELVAEIAGAFLCAHLGIQGRLQHAEYIQTWLKILKGDKKAIFSAARRATEAADYLRARAGEETHEETLEAA